MPSSASAAFRSKYGKYLPHQRFNVDQVPLPFVIDQDTTMHVKHTDPTLELLLILERIYNLALEDDKNPTIVSPVNDLTV